MTGPEIAAALAPDVDRLVVAIHRHMARRRAEVAALLEQTAVPSPALIVDLRPFLLESSLIADGVVREFLRFIPPREAKLLLDRLEKSRALIRAGAGFVPSAGARRFAQATTAMQAEIVSLLWRDHGDAVAAAYPVLGSAVRAAPSTLPLFGPLRALPEPETSRTSALHHRLTLFRYLRSDHHVAVLGEFGLTVGQAKSVDAAWRGDELAPEAEVAPGWVDGSGNLTESGLRRRTAIEAETNVRVAAAFDDLADIETLAGALAVLPS